MRLFLHMDVTSKYSQQLQSGDVSFSAEALQTLNVPLWGVFHFRGFTLWLSPQPGCLPTRATAFPVTVCASYGQAMSSSMHAVDSQYNL